MIKFDPLKPIVEGKNLYKEVNIGEDKLVILQSINLSVQSGETVAILGPSGAGKTTLLGILAGLDLPSTGEVFIGDTNLVALTEEQRTVIRGKFCGFIFQSFYLLDNLTALENVMLPLELQGHADAKNYSLSLLADVALSDRLTHYPQQLSGGEQQRVAIARAFASQPKILFADEPTGNLDEKTGNKIIQLLFRLNQEKQTTLVIVTHDLELAKQCQRQIYVSQGCISDITESTTLCS